MITIADFKYSARDIIRLLDDYNESHDKREMRLDAMVYAYFEVTFGQMSRQHWVHMHSKPKPQRIDFRHGTSNPVVFEFAVRTNKSLGTFYGSQNESELRKLTRVTPKEASTRVLLLIDVSATPIKSNNLRKTYDPIHAGKGKFKRHPVRVIYVHWDLDYDFLWKPFK